METVATKRFRRLRRTPTLRRVLRETELAASDLVLPLFVTHGSGVEAPIEALPGHARRSVDRLAPVVAEAVALGIESVLLFGIPAEKDAIGSSGWDADGPVPAAIRALKAQAPDLCVIADVCLCEYTDHGHCGALHPETHEVVNDETLPLLVACAVAYAEAGADVVAPSAMMDGQVAAIRAGLNDAGQDHVLLLSYAAKFASAFYGPFREAAGSTPSFGDRRGYQMDPANRREALREVAADVDEGADLVMVKPAGPYLDVIRDVRDACDLPLFAYQVSGEYAMLRAAIERGWLDERRATVESLIGIRRAGADVIVSYAALEVARAIADGYDPA